MTNAVRDPLTAARYDAAMARVRQLDAKIRDFERRHPRHAAAAWRITWRRWPISTWVRWATGARIPMLFPGDELRLVSPAMNCSIDADRYEVLP